MIRDSWCSGHNNMLKRLLMLQCVFSIRARDSLLDDLLLPYPLFSQHGPSHSNRKVRDCQPIAYGNRTHEEWPSIKNITLPLTTTKIFEYNFFGSVIYGHFTYINHPLRTFSVLEPGGPGGCDRNRTETVELTARHGKCIVAQNGGFFDVNTGSCIGNVVSNGKLVRNSKGIQNAQFGIKADGTMVFGYLSEEQVLDEENPFVQLLSGVVWLLRNGEVYIEDSKTAECDKVQTTGSLDHFINVRSARTAIGHDKNGRLILFHVEGKTYERGFNLIEMAEFLKDNGVVNAINLDGGGSATLVLNGTLSSYPSDYCVNSTIWHCPRKISTVVCVHEPFCDPADCGSHGQCVIGECQCTGYWTGPACKVLNCGQSNCSGHGNCTEDGCMCETGWEGSSCSKGPCWESKPSLFTEQTWSIVTATLAVLLLISAAFNVRQASRCGERRHEDKIYSYQRLQELSENMDVTDMCEPWDLYPPEYKRENHHVEENYSN
ncbi:N-acetylglucosamine-1-phosphodiester alpha-N-acetylglucosaminidase isoform X2 [Bombina bombina]|uniref:N-acetylglucosamine-1-phosphodiester alpha-N-acetylglucosaminidase isoform X2 n=1 Tax=Bombina bombina TaxID=8345 RepID=UPI00235A5C02|nr:N-acetylglucosamine-1-phosphodiester alpha-N-acetylglucosaminidase isoform X2 [Bombina bombina]